MTFRSLLASFLLFCFLLQEQQSAAQCTSTVNTFPYSEDFELTDGGWVSGGNASDWVWGIPHKPVINASASGQKCWIVAGLQNTAYNDNENSWLLSPCFDLRSVPHPYLHFKVFWETEKKYDGASLQYSTDGGNSWNQLGSQADYQACPSSNWFNTAGITTVAGDGWSGNIQTSSPCPGGAGSGSGGWVSAGHALTQLAGLSNVRFRFRFAAGSRCNDYDGFAVDDIWIGELQPANADFTFSCSAGRNAQFTPVTPGCGNAYAWDFGDPASGSSNSSSLGSPSHLFSNTGDFPVRLTVTAPGSAATFIIKTVRVVDVATQVVSPVSCHGGSDGSLRVQASPAGAYTYSWSTTPTQQAQTISGLPAGNYTVDVRGSNVCAARVTDALTDPAPLSHSQLLADARCGGANGKAEITPAGGTGPYSYTWMPSGGSAGSSAALRPGDYTVAIADALGCPDTARFSIGNNSDLAASLGRDTVLCAGETLLLQPAPGPFTGFLWQDGRTDASYLVYQSGDYSVQVTDADGCRASAAISVQVDCSDVQFPTAFTPNGDGHNDYFGPLGNRSALSAYTLRVYGRWGQLVFETRNPLQGWNGQTTGGAAASQVYVWVAQYRLVRHSAVQTRKGTVLIIR